MGNQKEGGVSASWDSNEVMIFCDLCIEEIQLGNRPATHFSEEGWKNLIVSFKQRTGKSYDCMQMKNKWDHLKKDWMLWEELKHEETRLRWDREKRTIAASDECWDEKIKVISAAKKLRYRGIAPELEEKINIMFSQVVETVEDSWAPSIGSVPPDMVIDSKVDVNLEDEVETQADGHDELGGNASTTIGNASTTLGKKRKMGKNKGVALAYMSELRKSALETKPPPVITIKETVELISSIPEIRSNLDLYYYAVNYIRDKNSREIFMSIPADIRVWWIKNAYENRTQADDEVVDPKNYLEESCKPKCVRPLRSYQACVERVKADESGHKHCTGQYFDYWSCVDSCVATKLFDKLK